VFFTALNRGPQVGAVHSELNLSLGEETGEGAIADNTEAIRLKPTNAWAYYNRGHDYEALGDLRSALDDYGAAIRADPTLAEPYCARGRLRVALLYAFLLSLLAEEVEAVREACLRWGCHRTGKRSRRVAAPLYRLRAALSRFLGAYPASPVVPSLSSG
jgi:tetratricopeptide (TPR) repeat protein